MLNNIKEFFLSELAGVRESENGDYFLSGLNQVRFATNGFVNLRSEKI
jgi:hypothetical protein